MKKKVTLMTVHASKGLEFKNVFIVGLEEDLFPSAMAKNEFKGLEEERRLFYVAITRAEEFCMVSYAKSRFRHGQINASHPSRFLRDIDTAYLKVNAGAFGADFEIPSTQVENRFANRYAEPQQTSLHRETTNTRTQPIPQSTRTNIGSQFVNARKAQPKTDAGTNMNGLQEGSIIKHERFGIGKVTALSGEADSRKATVEFENSGIKQLLLKFARFQIVD